MHLVAALDKFKGTATSREAGEAVARAARACGWDATVIALSDGGDGLLDVFGGPNRSSTVTGPLGAPTEAAWRLDGGRAVIESALASGLQLAGGAAGNDAVAATSRGTGELIEAAVRSGATQLIVGLGGSACSDGGTGALDALSRATIAAIGTEGVELVVCCDVRTRYDDAAIVFGPQKGATPAQVRLLTQRLTTARVALEERFGIDLSTLAGGGAAGGLGGALAAIGGQLRSGFDAVAAEVDLAATIAGADLVITGEGRLDDSSFDGKVVGGVVDLSRAAGVAVAAVVGESEPGLGAGLQVSSLVELFGVGEATGGTLECIERAARAIVVGS